MKRLHDLRVRPIDQAVNEALEARCATERAVAHWQRLLTGGQITIEQVEEGVRLSQASLREACEVVPMVERANELQKLGLQFAQYGYVTPNAAANARTIGIEAPTYDDAADD